MTTTPLDLEAVWAETLTILRPQMTRATYDTIVAATRLIELGQNGDSSAVVEAPTERAKDWLENRLSEVVKRSLTLALQRSITTISFQIERNGDSDGASIPLPNTSSTLVIPPPAAPLTKSDELAATDAPGSDSSAPPVDDASENSLSSQEKSTSPPAPPSNPILLVHTGPATVDLDFWSQLDYKKLFIEKGSSGFLQLPYYYIRFWMELLNLLKPKSFDIWLRVVAEDKRRVTDPDFTYWTPSRRFTLRGLGRMIGTTNVPTISGGTRPCWFNEAYKEGHIGVPLPDGCCHKYNPTLWDPASNRCDHWQIGILEVLYSVGLIAVEIIRNPEKPKSFVLRLQVWRDLPVLTPVQVSLFNDYDQERHAEWIERWGHLVNMDLAKWEELGKTPNLVPLRPGYHLRPKNCPDCQNGCEGQKCACKCHRSRKLWDVYEPGKAFFAQACYHSPSPNEAGISEERSADGE